VRDKLLSMKGRYTESSVRHFLIKTNLLLDQAVELGMAQDNPAREVSMRRDLNLRLRPSRERRTLTEEEIRQLLDASLRYPQYLNGGLPAVVRLGLYAALRNEEMCWLKWDCIDWDKRILTIQASVCEVTGESWLPKDFEARRIDVKEACIDFLRQEYQRQQAAGHGSPFVLPAGTPNVADAGDRCKHVHPSTPTKSFGKMIHDEGMDEGITVYTLRHTYATMALRAGVDLRTLQKRMGHSDIKTTMAYLHFIEPEQHPMDVLRY
jgi:integrase